MNEIGARRLAKALKGGEVGGWRVTAYVGAGKSAVVLRARRQSQVAALKVFDAELVARYGHRTQAARIRRELSLREHPHPHLVRIFDGGFDRTHRVFFIAMQLLQMKNLETRIASGVPTDGVARIIGQTAKAARHLEHLRIAHRDIKPSNIAVSADLDRAVLLDLGVIRPIELANITDDSQMRPFLGTLRYSPPEFLRRREKDTVLGWRAVTFYQLGAVLSDMLTGVPLFQGREPFAELVEAVLHDSPDLERAVGPPHLIELAKNCLVKDPDLRVRLVEWEDFIEPVSREDIRSVQARIRRRQVRSAAALSPKWRSEVRTAVARPAVVDRLDDWVRSVCRGGGDFPPIERHRVNAPTPGSDQLLVILCPASEKGVRCYAHVLFTIDTVNATANVVQVRVALAIGPNAVRDVSAVDREVVLFEGADPGVGLQATVERALYAALEATMDAGDGPPAESGLVSLPMRISE